MSQLANPYNALRAFRSRSGEEGYIYSLPALEEAGLGAIHRLPVCLRVVLESILRNVDGERIQESDVSTLAAYNAKAPADEIPFVVSRILLQDFTGVPLLVDLAAMRSAVDKLGLDPGIIEPLVPVDLVVDHSVQVDRAGVPQAFSKNVDMEFSRNRERYEFLKWGQKAFSTFNVIPPALGIVHQVNLEYLARGVFTAEIAGKSIFYPDTLVGTDSHTTMINGLGVVGWGVGGIEAKAGMLGQPIYISIPEVVGVHLTGHLTEGVTATDLTLRITEMLRTHGVVGKFVEFFGDGARHLTVADRSTISNMAPEYGATIGFFPVDEQTLDYLRSTGRSEQHVQLFEDYYKAQGMFGIPSHGEITYTEELELDLTEVKPAVAGPKRPQDLIELPELGKTFDKLFLSSIPEGGYARHSDERKQRVLVDGMDTTIGHGSVLIAAITSCTNTSNPSVMFAAGLVAKRAVELGMAVPPYVKTSLAPGSRVVTDYLNETGLQPYLDKLGFNLVGYGCTTCIGNSGPLDDAIEQAIHAGNLIAASVLSGNRNFEARIHHAIRANFLMSPPLVVIFALAGRVDIDLTHDPIGLGKDGRNVYLKDLWPTQQAIQNCILGGLKPEMFRQKYAAIEEASPRWNSIAVRGSKVYNWNAASTYIRRPPFFENFSMAVPPLRDYEGMRALALFGDSVTTDHISPAGAIPKDGPAGTYLQEHGVTVHEFNSFGSRRGNDRVMTRGTFANVRIKNLLVKGREGGWTKHMPSGAVDSIFKVANQYAKEETPLIVIGGKHYGMGSSRDWAAKGTLLLGVKAVVVESFERIHRSNLLGMGVLPLCFEEGASAQTLQLTGEEIYTIRGLTEGLRPRQKVTLEIKYPSGDTVKVPVVACIDTAMEVEYYRHGGILPFIIRRLVSMAKGG